MGPEGKIAFSFTAFALLLTNLFVPLTFAAYYDYYSDGQKDGLNENGEGEAGSNSFPSANPSNQIAPISNQIIYFAEPSPSPEPRAIRSFESTCFTSEMDAAEVARYQKGLMDFQAEQISTLSDEKLKSNDPTDKSAQQIQININLQDQPSYPVKDIASLLEYDDAALEEMAREFGVDKETGKLTLQQVQAVAARQPGGQDKVAKALGITQSGEIPKPAYENFKVVLPNGKNVPLKEILGTQPQDKEDACLLDRSFIHGKVTFQALLNKDLYVGFDESKTTVNAQQHITSKQTAAALNSYGGSMIVPKLYEKYVNTVGYWSTFEEWISLAGTISILFSREGVNGIIRKRTDDENEIKRLSAIQGGRISGESVQTERLIQTQLESSARIRKYDELLREVDFETVANKWKPLTIAMFGMAWMGAARIALSASNQVLFSSLATSDRKLKDNYMQIYVNNNDFLTEFRRSSDFFGSGKITEWASDLMEAGTPTKAFETGKIFYVSRDATDENQFSDSFTSFEKNTGGWQVKMDWKGRSENSIFEDIRKGGEYSSMALYSNNLELGTTVKNSEEFATYYTSIATLAPLVNFLIFRRAEIVYLPGTISALTRIGTFDFVVTRLVDPIKFKKDEVCDEEKVSEFENWYRVFAITSSIQSGVSIISPNQGLLALIGSYTKGKVVKNLFFDPQGKLTKYGKLFRYDKVKDLPKLEEEMSAAVKKSDSILDEWANVDKRKISLENINQQDSPLYESLVQRASILEDEYKAVSHEATALQGNIKDLKENSDYAKSVLSFNNIERAMDNLYKGLVLLDPVQLGKQVIASNGFRYVSLCKDTSYKILTYQRISGTQPGQTLEKKFGQLNKIDLGKQLNLTGLLGGIGKKVEEKSLAELLNMRAFMENPYGQLEPEDLFYIHLDGAKQQWFGVYDKLKQNGCFRECFDAKGAYVCADEKGVTYTDKTTGKSIKLSDNPDRGLLALMMQDLARTLIPNRIISAGLDNACSDNEILQVQAGRLGGSLVISDDSCGTIQCLRQQLLKLKADITTDLSASGFGEVVAVYTTEGRLTANNGKIRFLRGSGDEGDVGKELQAPSLEALEEKNAAELQGNVISIRGNGEVRVTGYLKNGREIEEEEVGKLLAIITENGKIEFDEDGKRLVVALYILAKTKVTDNIKSISTSIETNKDEKGNDVPSIAIDNAVPKVGGEDDAKKLNEALEKVQTDSEGNKGGFQVFETEDKRYTISTDEKGNPVLTILDKTTGKEQQYPITGPLRKEGNDVIIPTDKGDFKFSLDLQNGQPTLSAQGPDGFREIAALLAAKGAGGIIAFDPRTGLWYALNGQDIPWNDEFAKRGLSLYNTPDGTRGLAADNLYSFPRRGSGLDAHSAPLSIPSFPANSLYAALMLGAILAGVIFVRMRNEY